MPCHRRGAAAIEAAMERREIHPGSGLYCLGNAWLALKDYARAEAAYTTALEALSDPRLAHVAAQCSKNMGSVAEAQADFNTARQYYEKALTYDPDLGEAHFALALWHREHRNDLAAALHHLDNVVRGHGSPLQMAVIDGWRVELLFRTNEAELAFRDIRRLLAEGDKHDWIWPWCAQQVAAHGKRTTKSAQKALQFWRSYLQTFPDDNNAQRERLFCLCRLRMANTPIDVEFDEFKQAALDLINSDDPLSALLWDRIGHWAQEDGNWDEAERCYRHAHATEPDRYGYCLGVALNHQGRFEEALPMLLAQAEQYQPDAMSWFQVAIAREGTGDLFGSIAAYDKALKLDPEYDLAWFNLGGMHWNAGNRSQAIVVWSEAIARFPEHALTQKLYEDFPHFFSKSDRSAD